MDYISATSFTKVLHGDVKHCVEKLNEHTDFEFWGRCYIRAYASLIDGMGFIYQQLILSLCQKEVFTLSTEQQLFFNNVDWNPNHGGRIEITEKKLPTIKLIKTLFYQLSELLPGYSPDFGGIGWQKLQEFYPVRDALLHPKDHSGLVLTHDQLVQIEEGRKWLNAQMKAVNDELLKQLQLRS